MRRWLVVVSCVIGLAGSVEAALTAAQYREHIGRVFLNKAAQLTDRCAVISWMIQYSKVGTQEQEAARRFLRDYYQAVKGIDPATATANVKHDFTHFINDCSETYGEGFLP